MELRPKPADPLPGSAWRDGCGATSNEVRAHAQPPLLPFGMGPISRRRQICEVTRRLDGAGPPGSCGPPRAWRVVFGGGGLCLAADAAAEQWLVGPVRRRSRRGGQHGAPARLGRARVGGGGGPTSPGVRHGGTTEVVSTRTTPSPPCGWAASRRGAAKAGAVVRPGVVACVGENPSLRRWAPLSPSTSGWSCVHTKQPSDLGIGACCRGKPAEPALWPAAAP